MHEILRGLRSSFLFHPTTLLFTVVLQTITITDAQLFPPPPPLGPNGPPEIEDTKEYLGRYLITAPKQIRPGAKYSIIVNLMRGLSSDNTKITLLIRDDKNETVAQKIDPNVSMGQSKTIAINKIPTDALIDGVTYHVYVKGESSDGKVEFEEQKNLQFSSKTVSIFVQTDKGKYKPDDNVKYRVIVVKPNLKPYKGKVDVQITDPNQNTIQLYKDQIFNKVLPKFSIELEPQSIVTTDDDLEVTLKATYTYGKPVDGIGKVTVKYPWDFGGSNWVPEGQTPNPLKHQPIEIIGTLKDGELKAVFKNKDMKDRELIEKWGGSVKVLGEVLEDLTGNKREEETEVTVHTDKFKMDVMKSNENFKPGLPFKALISLKLKDDSPLPASAKRVIGVKTTWSFPLSAESKKLIREHEERERKRWEEEQKRRQEMATITETVNPDGTFSVEIPPPPQFGGGLPPLEGEDVFVYPSPPPPTESFEYVTLDSDGTKTMTFEAPDGAEDFNVQVFYLPKRDIRKFNIDKMEWEERSKLNLVEAGVYASSFKSITDSYIQLVPETTESVKAGDLKKFNLEMTDNIKSISLQVISRGNVVTSADKEITSRRAAVNIRATSQMAPKAKLIVYGVMDNDEKEVLVDAVEFSVDGLFANKVSVQLNPSEAEPGNNVTLSVRADPGSLIGLSAVDQSVLLLGGSQENSLTINRVEKEIDLYGSNRYGPWGPWFTSRSRSKRSTWIPWGVSGNDAKSIFDNAGLLVLSDAKVFDYNSQQQVMSRSFGFGGGAPQAFAQSPEIQNDGGVPPPPLAAPVSAAGFGGLSDKSGVAGAPPITVRKEFPETWLWTETDAGSTGMTMNAKVPDTITSWVISAFGINDRTGLGVAEDVKLKVFRPFFASLNLPYSVKRGEKVAIQVLVFNYMPRKQTVTVTLKHDANSGFDFVEKARNRNKLKPRKGKKADFNTRRVTIDGNGGSAAVFFPILPKVIGDIKLEVVARGQFAGDAVRRPLKVEPEGFRVEQSDPIMIDLSNQASFKTSLKADIPYENRDFVTGSDGAEVNIIGDVMGPVLANIDDLVRMPYGCGEQNMVNFVPNIVVLKTLKATKRLEPTIETKALRYMEAGYQRELTYKRKDNSFSAFGDSDKNGSTWLTAFVVKSFHQAKPYMFIDDKVLNDSITYIKSKQMPNGQYQEDKAVSSYLSGGASEDGVPLTAYVVISMLENELDDKLGVKFLENKLSENEVRRPYSMALTAYALQLADSPMKDQAFQKLENMSTQKDGLEYWTEGARDLSNKPKYWYAPPPADVEMTAYALLAYLARGQSEKALPIVRWLSNKRNANGGWSSTQDTVVALQALGEYSEDSYSPNFDVNAMVKEGGKRSAQFKITPDNALILKTYKVKDIKSNSIDIDATGSGVIMAQLNYHYNLKTDSTNAPFSCRARDRTAPKARKAGLKISLCCKYNKGPDDSGMAVLETDALSGYEFDEETMESLPDKIDNVQKLEFKKSSTKLDVYFDHLGKENTCFTMELTKAFKVGNQKPAQITLYDYYKPQDRLELKWSKKGKDNFEKSCPECWPLRPKSNKCRDLYGKCGNYCADDRTDRRYRRWIQDHSPWLRRFCQRSCAEELRIRRCL